VIAALLALAVATGVWLRAFARPEPAFAGRPVRVWFEEFIRDQQGSLRMTPDTEGSDRFQALTSPRAVPLLMTWVGARPSLLGAPYRWSFSRLGKWARSRLPPPLDSQDYQRRKQAALGFLGQIGLRERRALEDGQNVPKFAVTPALPRIRVALSDPDPATRRAAAKALWYIGWPAGATVVPALIPRCGDPDAETSNFAMQALGAMQSSASNAIPALAKIAATPRHPRRGLAIAALGQIGLSDTNALNSIAGILLDRSGDSRASAAWALAMIGATPAETVATLEAMTLDGSKWERSIASVALWNGHRRDEKLAEALRKALRDDTEDQAAWAYLLGRLGTNAEPFVPEVRALLANPDSFVRLRAARALRRMENVENR
jgi:HEAT repeat protein